MARLLLLLVLLQFLYRAGYLASPLTTDHVQSGTLTHCTSSPRSALCSSCHSNILSSSNCSIPVVISFSAAFRLQFFMTLFIQLLLPARISDTLATVKKVSNTFPTLSFTVPALPSAVSHIDISQLIHR